MSYVAVSRLCHLSEFTLTGPHVYKPTLGARDLLAVSSLSYYTPLMCLVFLPPFSVAHLTRAGTTGKRKLTILGLQTQ